MERRGGRWRRTRGLVIKAMVVKRAFESTRLLCRALEGVKVVGDGQMLSVRDKKTQLLEGGGCHEEHRRSEVQILHVCAKKSCDF